MEQGDFGQFGQGMRMLKDCYPGFKPSDAEFGSMLKAYFWQLRELAIVDVRNAIMVAPNPDCYPNWFPTAGQLQRLAEDERRRRVMRERQVEAKLWEQKRRPVEWGDGIPAKPELQREYIESAANPFEVLARQWECRSRSSGRQPEAVTRASEAQTRMREFGELVSRHRVSESVEAAWTLPD